MTGNISGIMITGTGSGCGKTAVTCALLSALKLRGKNVTAFKCGPDYIDPMFHSNIIGTKSRNLDVFLCGENTVKYLYLKNSAGADLSVIEGVMRRWSWRIRAGAEISNWRACAESAGW